MKRDWYLIAQLLHMVANDISFDDESLTCDPRTFMYHLELMKEAGFLIATDTLSMHGWDFYELTKYPEFRFVLDRALTTIGGIPTDMLIELTKATIIENENKRRLHESQRAQKRGR